MAERVLIVGGGIAGLTAGIYAAKAGHAVTILEKNEKCGGLVNSFVRDGFLFDGGTRALEGFLFPLLKDIGLNMEYIRTPVSLGIEDTIIRVENEADIDAYRHILERLYPNSLNEIARIFKPIKKMGRFLKGVNRVMSTKKGIGYLFTERLPGLLAMLANIGVLITMNTPIEQYFTRVLGVTNQSLIDSIIQHFFKGTPAFFALGYLYLYPDYIYAQGGTGMLAVTIEEKTREYDITIQRAVRVVKVLLAEKAVVDVEGRRYTYDKLIWSADLKTLYRCTETAGLDTQHHAAFLAEKEKILAHRGAESIFTLYIAVDEDPEYFAKISTSHLFYTPSRQGLGSLVHEEQLYIIEHWDELPRKKIFEWLERLVHYNTFEVAIPVLKTPDAAPPHQTGIIISFLFAYEIAKKARDAGWYDELKERVSHYIVSTISESLYKGFEKKILFTFASTPLTIEEMSGSSEGAVIGWSMETPSPVTSSMLQMTKAVQTSLPDVFKAGQWTMSPAGIPTAVMTGQLAAAAIKTKRRH